MVTTIASQVINDKGPKVFRIQVFEPLVFRSTNNSCSYLTMNVDEHSSDVLEFQVSEYYSL